MKSLALVSGGVACFTFVTASAFGSVKTYCSNADGSLKRVSHSDYVRDTILYIHHGKVLSLYDVEALEVNKQVLSKKETQSQRGRLTVETYSAYLSVKQNNGESVAKDWVSCRSEKVAD